MRVPTRITDANYPIIFATRVRWCKSIQHNVTSCKAGDNGLDRLSTPDLNRPLICRSGGSYGLRCVTLLSFGASSSGYEQHSRLNVARP